MDLGLKDRRVVVTGAASGIGLAVTEVLVAEGALVVAADLETSAGELWSSWLRRRLPDRRDIEWKAMTCNDFQQLLRSAHHRADPHGVG